MVQLTGTSRHGGGGANRNLVRLVHGVRVYQMQLPASPVRSLYNLLVCGAAAGALPRPGELLCAACADLVRLPSQPPLARPHTAGYWPLSGVNLELFNHRIPKYRKWAQKSAIGLGRSVRKSICDAPTEPDFRVCAAPSRSRDPMIILQVLRFGPGPSTPHHAYIHANPQREPNFRTLPYYLGAGGRLVGD